MRSLPHNTDMYFPESELILNPDGTIFHLHLKPGDIAEKIIVVGDQGRVKQISKNFNKIEVDVQNREFCTHTGWINGERITALSTGIGTDNIDIVLNELDALANIDFDTRKPKKDHTKLQIIRIGTCGGLQPEIAPGDFIASSFGFGLDGMLNYYDVEYAEEELKIRNKLIDHLGLNEFGIQPYIAQASESLVKSIDQNMHRGITITANGFYGPQGRALRIPPSLTGFNDKLETFNHNGLKVVNYEMETSALFGLGATLGHECATFCVVVASRSNKTALTDYKPKIEELIQVVLSGLTTNAS